jgi:hypothetical protein
MTETMEELTDPRISGKEEKWVFQVVSPLETLSDSLSVSPSVKMSAIFRHKGTPEDGYMYVYQLHARIGNMEYGHIYNPDKFSFEKARKHFEEIIKGHLTRKEPK